MHVSIILNLTGKYSGSQEFSTFRWSCMHEVDLHANIQTKKERRSLIPVVKLRKKNL